MSNIKIFITYKNKHQILENEIIKPIQTGRAISDEAFEGMIGDDTGDNISSMNNYFCESSAIYWVWKNYDKIENPDYIGFMHYRRHFLFGKKKYTPNYCGLVKFDFIDKNYLSNHLTTPNNINEIVSQLDAVIPDPIYVVDKNCKNNYQQYTFNHIASDYDKMIQIINEDFPEYVEATSKYNQSEWAYFLNMFIFKKEIFFKYCEFLFGVLLKLKDQIDYERDDYQNRALGFISERLTGIFISKILEENNYKVRSLPVSFIQHNANLEQLINYKNSVMKNYAKNCLNYWRCRLLQNITFGKKKLHYKNKKNELKQKIKDAKGYIKND